MLVWDLLFYATYECETDWEGGSVDYLLSLSYFARSWLVCCCWSLLFRISCFSEVYRTLAMNDRRDQVGESSMIVVGVLIEVTVKYSDFCDRISRFWNAYVSTLDLDLEYSHDELGMVKLRKKRLCLHHSITSSFSPIQTSSNPQGQSLRPNLTDSESWISKTN